MDRDELRDMLDQLEYTYSDQFIDYLLDFVFRNKVRRCAALCSCLVPRLSFLGLRDAPAALADPCMVLMRVFIA